MALIDFLTQVATAAGFQALDDSAADDTSTATDAAQADAALGRPAPGADDTLRLQEPGPDNTSELGDKLQLRAFNDRDLFTGEPREGEPIQGFLGNCPLVAILVAMAHVPHFRAVLHAFGVARRVERPYSSFRQRQAYEYNATDLEDLRQLHKPLPRLPAARRNFTGDHVFAVNFFSHPRTLIAGPVDMLSGGFSVTEYVTPVLWVQADIDELFYGHSSRRGLWVSLIEKAYIRRHDSKPVPDYQSLEASITPRLAMFELCGWSREGLLSTVDAVAAASEAEDAAASPDPLETLSTKAVNSWLALHNDRPTVLGSLMAPADADIIGNHAFAVTGFDAKGGLVTLEDALQEEGTPTRVVKTPLANLRLNFGEIVQGPSTYGVSPDRGSGF